MARRTEAVRGQQPVVRGNMDNCHTRIDAVDYGHPSKKQTATNNPTKKQTKSGPNQPASKASKKGCTRCGKFPTHPRNQCPACEAKCHKCGKQGHYQSMCRSATTLATVQTETEPFLGTIKEISTHRNRDQWMVDLQLNGKPVQFKIDTGADVTAVSEEIFKKLDGVSLRQTDRSLHGPAKHKLVVCGQFTGTLTYKQLQTCQEIFVVKELQQALMGRPAIEALHLISRIDYVDSSEKFVKPYPDLFTGLGTLGVEYHIQLRQDANPYVLTTPRRIALPLLPKVKQELTRMENLGVITKVDNPTDWCAGMVVVPKPNGNIRICVDLTKLNASVRRERHILPSVEQILAQIGGSTIFSKLDANAGFWQIKLSKQSALLTTFITPYGRYCFNRLPFGITSAPEFFQKQMSNILSGLEGVVCMIDDVLVHGKTQLEHDQRLTAVLDRLRKAKVTLNKEKCEFSKHSIRFLGQVIDQSGIRPDQDKVKAIQAMNEPENVTELRRFLGMTTQLSKFTPHLSETTKPLRDLLSTKNSWVWSEPQQKAFQQIKQQLSSTPVLALYHPNRLTTVSADSSSFGIGAVLTQKQSDGNWRPITYCSRSLSNVEQRYAQIEKEALALTWGCERFNDYLLGKHFHAETDHKPLVSLLGTKNLEELPIRVQRFRMRLMRFSYTISYVPGKKLVADALSRAPVSSSTHTGDEFQAEVEMFANTVVQSVPATEKRLKEIQKAQEADEICQKLYQYCKSGWPHRQSIAGAIQPYISVASEITVHGRLLLKGNRIIIPSVLRLDILDKLHSGHQGISKCRERARQAVWWPGLSRQLEELVCNCPKCCRERHQHPEPLMTTELPNLPWQK